MKLLLFALLALPVFANNCLVCHKGIEDIREQSSQMSKEIAAVAKKAEVADNSCVVCHGGDPKATTKQKAHSSTPTYFLTHKGPKEFYPNPSSSWINNNTCGMCHPKQVASQMNSLMMSEGGKIQGAMWSFGALEQREHSIANYSSKNPSDPHERLGTQAYRAYMEKLEKLEPQAFPKKLTTLPAAPTADEVQKDPQKAVFTYLRQECLRCHTGSKGRSKQGDYRGSGCASCHIPYSNSGLYEGGDAALSKTEPSHMLTHQIQSSRKVNVDLNDINYSGVPVESCAACHNRGKRIGVSYQGLMESAYSSNYDHHGKAQQKLHTKRYLHMHEDVHYQKGLLCQDCHTSNDLHGDGFIAGANAASVEVECQDCHGTTKKYPWELPLGYSDEFGEKISSKQPRGVAKSLPEYLNQGYVPKNIHDGYLRTARGNPFPKTLKKGNTVEIHLASGKTITLKPLKLLKEEEKLSKEAIVAMDSIAAHTSNMECYSCHAKWAPQCYGCHVKIDYSNNAKNPDYLMASHDHDIHGVTGEMKNLKDYLVDGKVTETRSYLRWEDPILVQNAEGRVSPAVPGCQVSITVVGKDGTTLLQNKIFKVTDNNQSVNAIDMAPLNPHTISKEARSCESCHTNKKTMGYGLYGLANPSKGYEVDIMSADKKLLTRHSKTQIEPIENLIYDWSKIIDSNHTQLMTVGHHFRLSAPLSKEQLSKLDRRGVCLGCHQDIPTKTLAVSLMTHISEISKLKIDTKTHNSILNKILNISAFVQVVGGVLLFFGIVWVLQIFRRKK